MVFSTAAGAPFSRVMRLGMTTVMKAPATGLGDMAGLLAAVASGDRAALAQLYRRTSSKLYGICIKVLRDEAEAEEALQESFVTIWNKAGLYDPKKASPLTWLSVLARNKAIDRVRLKRIATTELGEAAEFPDDSPSAFEVLESANDRVRLAHCLEQLEERYRSLIRAAFVDGASYPELAEREAVPLGTMKSWIRRSLLRLRGCLEQ
jgi:RNA polymerase sigma-70 factor (ECF subfamily)